MREALDNMDGCGGVDDVIRQASSLYLSDDYKEVKDHVLLVCVLSQFFIINQLKPLHAEDWLCPKKIYKLTSHLINPH